MYCCNDGHYIFCEGFRNMEVKFIHTTPEGEKHIAYCARVSSPHQDNPNYAGLLKYCIKNQHWSIFEMASMCIEITTSRAISAQILRHKSFSFQEFSQRYAEIQDVEVYEARRQDTKNRQNSIDDMSSEDKDWFLGAQEEVLALTHGLYKQALSKGVAKEQARMLLPMATTTKLYMMGSIRSWITYLNLRTAAETQKEHRDVALACQEVFKQHYPIVSEALGWKDKDENKVSESTVSVEVGGANPQTPRTKIFPTTS